MRVVSGSYRGRRLVCPEGSNTRPTLDRVKENLYNLLGDVSGARVLDLFAGAGGLGVEAVSRGAARTVFGDRDPEALRCLGRNLERMAGEYEILRGDWSDTLDKLSRRGETFDVVFLDPPYEAGLYAPVLRRLEELRLLADGAVVCVESDRELTFAGYAVRKERRYGLVRVYLLEVCP